MFDHVTIHASDREASERFYDTVLPTLGVETDHSGDVYAEWGDFSLASAGVEKPVTRRLHIAFFAPSREHVDEFWRTGTEAGYRDDGPPGPRPQYNEDYYGSFLLDPDGNSAEAVHHGADREAGWIDHIWMRVANVNASKRSTSSLRLTVASGSSTAAATVHSSWPRAAPSRLCGERRRRKLIWRSRRETTRRWTPSIVTRSRPGTATTVRPVSGRSTTPATTGPSSSTQTATTSRS
jgi:catechol 2,3-dioxygenase-like lactoylglutathione lyase family enzyme